MKKREYSFHFYIVGIETCILIGRVHLQPICALEAVAEPYDKDYIFDGIINTLGSPNAVLVVTPPCALCL